MGCGSSKPAENDVAEQPKPSSVGTKIERRPERKLPRRASQQSVLLEKRQSLMNAVSLADVLSEYEKADPKKWKCKELKFNGNYKMDASSTGKIEDLQAYVPNLTMSETGIGTNIYVRGIGSGINQGFEQSVGMYVDGVYAGRVPMANIPLTWDVARVEILKGPQGILFGKNTIGGAINITTNRPTFELEGSIEAKF